MAEFLMPKLGSDMTSGTLVAWLKKPGDVVKRGDIVAEVETEKGVIGVEIFSGGVIEKLVAQPGQVVNVGKTLAIVREDQTTIPPTVAPATISPPPAIAVKPTTLAPQPVSVSGSDHIRISPAARELAHQLGIEIENMKGSGPQGAITRHDVENYATAQKSKSEKPIPPVDRQARLRETVAAAMSRSKREIPHYYLGTTIDMHAALSWLAAENLKRSITDRILYGVLLVKAVAWALREVPELNATWEGKVVLQKEINIGMAISLRQGGLIAPAIHHVDQLTVLELMGRMRDLVNRARAGTLRSSELSDPTITVTNLGEQGVESVYGVIYPPQVAIVGFGKIVERPWIVEGQVVPRPMITATLSADHRVSDGHRGGRFLAFVDRLLQEPGKL